MISGFATAEGTTRYADRFPPARDAGHFRRAEWVKDVSELSLSSFGIGTYLGETDSASDSAYTAAIAEALRSGINVVDTAINYRHQHSERNIGAALSELIAGGQLQRDEVLVCSKAGYLSFDGEMPPDPGAYFLKEYVEPGILDRSEIAGGSHCMAPKFLTDQLERSRKNLGLKTIDVFYLHNPETQLGEIPPKEFVERLQDAFGALEDAVLANKIRWYGVATWNAFRIPPAQKGYMPLEAVLQCAYEVGGADHHFRFIQLPFNLAMPEAWAAANQQFEEDAVASLEFASRMGLAAVGSATLAQGQLAGELPEFITKRMAMGSAAANAIQFARSAPGIVTALVGMSKPEHVKANAVVASHPLAAVDDWRALFRQ